MCRVPSLLRLGLAQIGSLILASADELGALADLLGAAGLLDRILCCQGGGHAPALVTTGRQVRLVEESREQDKVAEVHGDRQVDVALRDVAGRGAVRLQEAIGPHIDRTADDHLCQLQRRYDHRDEPGRIEAGRLQRIVAVHHRVHAVVHHDEPAGRAGVFRVAEPRVDQHGDVVIPVRANSSISIQFADRKTCYFR